MSIILKQETASSIPSPTLGKGTLFLDATDQLVIKDSDGNVSTLLTLTATGNTDVIYNNAGEVGLSSNMTFNNTTNTFAVTNANVGNLTVTGTLTAGNITVSKIANGTSNIDIVSASGNVTIGVAGNANVLTVTGSSVIVSGNANVGNLSTAQVLASANITTPQFISNVTTGTAPIVVTSTTQVANLNAATAGLATYATTANAVALANVSGAGNIASLNTDGNASNILYGNGVFASVPVTYGNSNVATFLASYGSNTISTTGNITAGNIVGNGQALTGIAGANVSGQVANALVAGTVYTNAQPNITSVGTLTSLTVNGNVNGANLVVGLNGKVYTTEIIDGGTGIYLAAGPSGYINFFTTGGDKASISDTGNIVGSNLVANSTVFATTANISGNVNAGNVSATTFTGALSGAATTAGTVTTNAQPNITSVGTLSSLAVTGNVSGGNLTTGGLINATGNIQSNANVVTDLIAGRTSGVTITAAGTNQNINLTPTGTGTVNVGNFIISNVATPLTSTDAATKQYVDDVAQGLHTHDSCNAATQTTLASISGGTVTYNNGTSGVGATLTTTGAYTTIDGVTLSNGMRILVKDEVTTANNGIYVRTSATVLTRADDFDTTTEMAGGDFTFVTAGTLYDNTGWVMVDVVTTVGTSPVVWVQFSGAGTYTAGTGLTLNGSQFSITNTTVTAGAYGNGDYNATFTVNDQGQLTAAANVAITANAANLTGTLLNSSIVTSSLTSVGTLTSLGVTGNISAGNVNAGNLLTANYSTAVITTAAQPNITSVGTLTSLAVTGNISAGNVSATNFTGLASSATVSDSANSVAGANVSGQVANALVAGTVYTNAQPNITSTGTLTSLDVTGNISAGNVNAGNLLTANYSTAVLTTAAQPNITSVGTLTSLAVTGNTTSGNFIGTFANGNSNVKIATANGNVTIASVGNTTLTITGTGANISGYATVTGNVTAAYYSGNGSPLTGVIATIRTVTVADATSVTMNTDTSDIVVQTNTQVAGTLTINAITGTPINGQKIILRLQSANVQTFAWNAVFTGSTDTPLPTASSGSNKYDYLGFIYNSIATKWQMMAKNFGF